MDRVLKKKNGNGEKDVATDTVGLNIRRERIRCTEEEDITRECMRRAITLQKNEKIGGTDGVLHYSEEWRKNCC